MDPIAPPPPPFRAEAVHAALGADERGTFVHAPPPTLRRLVAAVCVALAAATVGAAVARVPVTARGRGIVRPAIGVTVVRAPAAGTVRALRAAVGQRVRAGDTLALLDAPLRSPVDGLVDDLPARVGDFVAAGDAVAKVIADGHALVGFMALPARDRARVTPGQPARLSLDARPATEAGFGAARVLRVSDDVITPELAGRYLAEVPPTPHFLVVLTLDAMPPAAPGRFETGMTFEGVVTVRDERLLALALRPLRRLFQP